MDPNRNSVLVFHADCIAFLYFCKVRSEKAVFGGKDYPVQNDVNSGSNEVEIISMIEAWH